MLRNIRLKDNNVMNIDGFHYYETPGFSMKKLCKMLSLDSSFLKTYNDWYVIDNELYFFKPYRKFTELFMQELIEEYDLRHVTYRLAYSDDTLGVISKNFKDPNNKYYDYDTYFIRNGIEVPRDIERLSSAFDKLLDKDNKKKIMEEFLKLTVFDWFSGQIDRGDTNLIIEKRDNGTFLAPIFDNGCSLEIYNTEYNSSFENLDFSPRYEYCKEEEYILYLLTKYKTLRDYLSKSLDIDIRKILRRTLEKYKLELSKEDQQKIIRFFDFKKDLITRKLNRLK